MMTPPYRQNLQKTSQPPANGAVTFLTLPDGIDCWQLIAFLAAMRTFFSKLKMQKGFQCDAVSDSYVKIAFTSVVLS